MPYQPDSCLWEEEVSATLTRYGRRRVAVPAEVVRRMHGMAEKRGYRIKRILIGELEIYPRYMIRRDWRIVPSSWFVEAYRLTPGVYRLRFKFAPIRLYRVKVRLYSGPFRSKVGKPYPEGFFQGWMDILTALHFQTGMPLLEGWWFSRLQLNACRIGFVVFWKGRPFRRAYVSFRGREGIIARSEGADYTVPRTYHYDIPPEFTEEASRMTVEEVVFGISNVAPEVYADYERDGGVEFVRKAEDWEVIFQRAMIILEDGTVKYDKAFGGWDRERGRAKGEPLNHVLLFIATPPVSPVWVLTDAQKDRLRGELDP